MNCDDFFDMKERERDERASGRTLALEESGALATHESACTACAELARAYPIADAIAEAIPSEIEPPPWMRERILMAARAASEPRPPRRISRMSVLRLSLVAAGAVLCLVVGSSQFEKSRPIVPEPEPIDVGGDGSDPALIPSYEQRLTSPDHRVVVGAHLGLMRCYAKERDPRALSEAQKVLADDAATDDEKKAATELIQGRR